MLIDIKDLYKIYNEGQESEVRALGDEGVVQPHPGIQGAVEVIHLQRDGEGGHALARLALHGDVADGPHVGVPVVVGQADHIPQLDEADVPVVHLDGDRHDGGVLDGDHRPAVMYTGEGTVEQVNKVSFITPEGGVYFEAVIAFQAGMVTVAVSLAVALPLPSTVL